MMLKSILVVLNLLLKDGFASIQCKNENGEDVDWFYIYKLPRERNHINPLIRTGVGHMYITPQYLRQNWIMSDVSIGDAHSMVGKTLAPMYSNKDLVSLIYNDQLPQAINEPDSLNKIAARYTSMKKETGHKSRHHNRRYQLGEHFYDDNDVTEMCNIHKQLMMEPRKNESGHTKGLVLADNATGLWLVHSVPHFAPVPDFERNVSYSYPATGMKFGQTFLCLSLNTSTLNKVAVQLQYNEPLIAYSHMPTDLRKTLETLYQVMQNVTVQSQPWYHKQYIQTLKGRSFLSFAKSGRFGEDLYSSLVAKSLQTDLLVETWMNGPGTLDSECNFLYKVRNIQRIKFPVINLSFSSHLDHSKWAVAVAHKMHNTQDTQVAEYWVCVGDINRAISQEYRGGGTVCTMGPILWGAFAHLIESVQSCNNTMDLLELGA